MISQIQGVIMMIAQQEHQLQFIWEELPSPITLPEATQKRLANIYGEFLADYWERYYENNNFQQKGDNYE